MFHKSRHYVKQISQIIIVHEAGRNALGTESVCLSVYGVKEGNYSSGVLVCVRFGTLLEFLRYHYKRYLLGTTDMSADILVLNCRQIAPSTFMGRLVGNCNSDL